MYTHKQNPQNLQTKPNRNTQIRRKREKKGKESQPHPQFLKILKYNMNSDFWVMEDVFDFPMEAVEADDLGVEDVNADFQKLEPPPWNDLLDLNLLDELKSIPFLCTRAPQLKPQPSFQCTRAPQVKPQGSTTDTSSSRSICLSSNSNDVKDSWLLQSSSPVSVLGRSSSCSAKKSAPINPKLVFAVKRSRSKSRRRATLNSFFVFPFISSTSSTSEEYNPSTTSESGSEINLTEKSTRKKQKRKKNLTMLSGSKEIKKSYFQQAVVPRKCMHCEVTETPQWRAGPMGPKTLCNACGVRYRSGRLVPEYRPAASPTFVTSLHSNSHKRIMEMRIKGRQ